MTITRSHLRNALQEAGFTYREARLLVTVIFEALLTEIKKGDTLELPFGSLTLRQPKPRRVYQLGRIVKTYTKPKVHFRRKD